MKNIQTNNLPRPTPKLTQYLLLGLGALIFIATLVFRINYINAPLDGDESIYAYLGKIALGGGIPYVDFYEMKPLLLFYTYGITAFIFRTAAGLHIASILVCLAQAYILFIVLSRKFSKESSFLAVTIFFWMYSSPYVFGNYLQSEHFVNLFTVLAIYFVYQRPMIFRNIFLAGIFIGLAFLVKQTALFFLPPIIILLSIQNESFKKFLFDSTKLVMSALVPIIIAFIIVYATGGLNEAKFWLIDFPSEYAMSTTIEDKFYFLRLFGTQIIGFQYILWTLVLISLLILLYKIKNHNNIFILSFMFFSGLTIVPGFRYYGHYWLLFIPATSFALAYLIEFAIAQEKLKYYYLTIFSILMLFQLKSNSGLFYSNDPDKEISDIHFGQYFDIVKNIGSYLDKTLSKNDDLLVLGAIPQIYIYTDKIACTRHVYQPMLNYTNAKSITMRKEMMNDLEKSRPKYVLFSFNPYHWGLKDNSNDNLYTQSYRFVENNYERIAIFENTRGKKYLGNEAKSITLAANMYVVYKLTGS